MNQFKLEGNPLFYGSLREIFSISYLLPQVHGTQLGWLDLGVHHDVEHGADGLRHSEVCGPAAPLKLGLKGCPCPSEGIFQAIAI